MFWGVGFLFFSFLAKIKTPRAKTNKTCQLSPGTKSTPRASSSAGTARAAHQAAPIAVMLLAGEGSAASCTVPHSEKPRGTRVGCTVPLGKKDWGRAMGAGARGPDGDGGWLQPVPAVSFSHFPSMLVPGLPPRSRPAEVSSGYSLLHFPAPAMHFPSPFDISPLLRHPPTCRLGARFHVDVLFLTTVTGSCQGCLSHHHEPIVSVLLGLVSGGPNRSTGMAKRQPGLPPLAPSSIRRSLGCSLAGFSPAHKKEAISHRGTERPEAFKCTELLTQGRALCSLVVDFLTGPSWSTINAQPAADPSAGHPTWMGHPWLCPFRVASCHTAVSVLQTITDSTAQLKSLICYLWGKKKTSVLPPSPKVCPNHPGTTSTTHTD